jgi:hypothetical protein
LKKLFVLKILLLSITLFSCGSSELDRCLEAEIAKAEKLYKPPLLTASESNLVENLLPIMRTGGREIDHLWQEHQAGERMIWLQYLELERKAKCGQTDWECGSSIYDEYLEKKGELPHRDKLSHLIVAWDAFWDLLDNEKLPLLGNLSDLVSERCNQNAQSDPNQVECYIYFPLEVIEQTYRTPEPNFRSIALETCHRRGVY